MNEENKNLEDDKIEIGSEVNFDLDEKETTKGDPKSTTENPTTSPKPEAPKEEPKPESSGISIEGSTITSGGDTTIAEQVFTDIKNEYATYNNYYSKEQERRLFSMSHLQTLEINSLKKEALTDFSSFDSNDLTIFEKKLLENRVILIYGESDLGKFFLAKKLALLLNNNHKVTKIFNSKTLHKSLNIDLTGFLKKNKSIENSVIIFNDFLENNNNSIKQFFLSLKKATIKNLLKNPLEKSNSYLIFTSSPEYCEEILESLFPTKISSELKAPNQDLLSEAFDKLLVKHFMGTTLKLEKAEALKSLLQNSKEDITLSLGKIGAINSLITNLIYRSKRKTVQEINKTLLFQELNRVTKSSDWFSTELQTAEDLLFWSITFTLCQCKPGNQGISIVLFEKIRREILAYAQDEKLIKNKDLESLILRSEQTYIEKCQAEVTNHYTTNDQLIRYKEQNFKEKIWSTLLHSHATLISRIFTSVEQLADHSDYKVRYHAAIMLGRLSEGFPEQTKPILLKWSTDQKRQTQVGAFFTGVWAIKVKKQKDRFFNFLANLSQSGGSKKKLSIAQYQSIHSAIRAYTELAPFLYKSTLKAFGNILENRLGKQVEIVNQITKNLEKFELFASSNIKSFKDAVTHDARQMLGVHILNILFKEKKEDYAIAVHIQHALAHLCITIDTATIFKELTKWILKGNKNLQILLTNLFLEDGGMADILNQFSIQINNESISKKAINCHPIVYSLLSGENAIKSIATFVNRIMDALYLLPLQSRRLYRQYLFFHLRKWVKNSTQIPVKNNPMVALYVEIMLTSKEMESEIKNDMEYQFTKDNAKFFEFKKAVQRLYFKSS